MSEEQLPCPHSRADWRHCPHCLGINNSKIDAAAHTVLGFRTEQLKNALADNERLKGLIKKVEWDGCGCGSEAEPTRCPWCLESEESYADRPGETHRNCPAFTPDGVVK